MNYKSLYFCNDCGEELAEYEIRNLTCFECQELKEESIFIKPEDVELQELDEMNV